MGVYIKGIEMPKSCSDCFYVEHCTKCIFGKIIMNKNGIIFHMGKKPDDCPLEEIEDE